MEDLTPTKRHYCTVCSHYRGKIVNGRIVSLHRFPMNDRVRNAWIRRLCSEHFIGGQFEKNMVPSIFGERRFNTTTLENITPMLIDDNVQPLEKPEPLGQTINLKSGHTSEQTSLLFHDYVGIVIVDGMNNTLNKDCQTNIGISSTSVCTQTPKTDKSDASTQTEIIVDENEIYYATKLCDCLQKSQPVPIKTFANSGTQCNKPIVTIEDINSEFFTETPQSLSNKSLMFSSYKQARSWA